MVVSVALAVSLAEEVAVIAVWAMVPLRTLVGAVTLKPTVVVIAGAIVTGNE
jgi:hypothetical protein